MSKKFDSIVVGAGPAGCSAAYKMAKDGLNVLVIERGEYPGSKNMSGALLYSHCLSELFPSFWQEAPVERFVTNWKLVFLTSEQSLALDFKDGHFASPPFNGFTVLRSKFDPWLAKKAEEAGALIMTGTHVEDLLWENDRVVGVRTRKENGDVRADVVIVAEGANAILTEKADLKKRTTADEMAVGVKEVIKLSRDTINERFNLKGDEGTSVNYIGALTRGVIGGGFLYTNKESISVGLVCRISGLAEKNVKIFELMEEFKAHPQLQPLIAGGRVKEYAGHTIPEGGYKSMPGLYSGGLLVAGEAASLNFNNGFVLRGMDYAMASGIAAARSVSHAKSNGDFSKKGLSIYQKELEGTFVLKDLNRFKRLPEALSNPRIFTTYPELLGSIGREIFGVTSGEQKKLWSIINDVRKREGIDARADQLIRDVLGMGLRL
jgi:electron transfer flavoprotein-quinone oxidoreductase